MKICLIIGTRPEIIKMTPIIRTCEKKNLDYFIIHTNQHYSKNMNNIFFKELELKHPRYNLQIGSGLHGEQTGKMLIAIEKILIKEKPDIVLVQGDTNTVFAGALTASKLHIKVGHIEAGLRSGDMSMPEEINRILTDHISNYLFVPTTISKSNLINEGIAKNKIILTGNTIVDAISQNLEIAKKNKNILKKLNIESKKYFLITFHRQENVDSKKNLKNILRGIELVYRNFGLPIILPIHPRSKKQLEIYNLKIPKGLIIIEPVGYLEFLQLEVNARLIITDSGGLQEEACILKIPCVTLRENTERPETILVYSNILAGTNPNTIFESVKIMIDKENNWKNPFGKEGVAEKILNRIITFN